MRHQQQRALHSSVQYQLPERQPHLDRLAEPHLVSEQEPLREALAERPTDPQLMRPWLDRGRRHTETICSDQQGCVPERMKK